MVEGAYWVVDVVVEAVMVSSLALAVCGCGSALV